MIQIVSWISKIEVLGERRGNFEDQTSVLAILNHFCTDYGLGKDCMAIQKRIRIQLFNIGTNPMKRGVIFFSPEPDPSKQRIKEGGNNLEIEGMIQSGKDANKSSAINLTDELVPLKRLEAMQSSLKQSQLTSKKIESWDVCAVKIFKPSNSRIV